MALSIDYQAQTKYYTDNEIVPQEQQHQLLYWRDQFRYGYFAIGDIANDLIAEIADSGMLITQDRIHEAVGNFVGKSERTIRYYAEVAAFYPEGVRQHFDMLPFSHFVLAKQYDNWALVLSIGMDNPSLSVKAIRARMEEYLACAPACAPLTDAACAPQSDTVCASSLTPGKILAMIDCIATIREKASTVRRLALEMDRLSDTVEGTISAITQLAEALRKQIDNPD